MARKSSTRSRKSTREYDDVPETGDVVTVEDDLDPGFDADLDVDEEPKKKPARKKATRKTATKKKAAPKKKKKATRKKKAEPDETPEVDEAPDLDDEAPPDENTSAWEEAERDTDDDGFDESLDNGRADDGGRETNESNESSDSNESNDSADGEEGGGRRRRRRRRRRGGRGGGGGDQQPQNQQQQRGRNGRNDRDQQPQRQRSRRGNAEEITGSYEGILELHPKNYGFLRAKDKDYASQDSDPFVSSSLIDKYGLREGVLIKGDVGPGSRNQGPRLKAVETIDGRTPEEYAEITNFDELTPINPFEQIKLERGAMPITMRVLDLLTPIGKGQRALIVAPPRSGKTMLMQDIAESVSENHPEIHLMVLLIDERPEEVTEMRRMINGEVIASSMDRELESHIRVSQLLVERAKRMAEAGKDVLVLLDSITRLGRAFNKWSNSGRTGTGGIDVRALDIPRKLFGTARRFDEGGSLTVIGTALIETGSRGDEAIFQEFKGTGNMELVLSRDLADRRIYPAMDIAKSGTRREEKLLDPETLQGVTMLRRSLVSLSAVEAMEQLVRTLERFPTNKEFLERVKNVL